ncbi:MAG: energy transducer TonB, partial [Spirosomaceae bacterium]|nr:energy transducer TonB [Spirosomataceae bacterium]
VYREGKLINPHTFDSSGNTVDYCGEVLRPPLFQGHRDSLYKYVGNHIIYPLQAMQAGKGGKALIWIKINKEGRVICAVGISSLGYGIEEATTEVFRKMPLWQPAMLDCEASEFDFIFPFTLKMTNSFPRR